METKSTTERLAELLAKETKKFAKKEGSLKEIYSKFSKIGIDTKSTYSFPLKDTIGKTFREQLQFTSTEQNPLANKGYGQ
ncbi:MAG: hypothetical protein Q7U47_04650 [Paludibacter sp.]|nr:hypothetical protein [Paludibacter sp.]